MRRMFISAGAALLLAAPISAQSKPDFSGTWIVVAAQGAAAQAPAQARAAGRNAGAANGAAADARAAVQAARANGASPAEARAAAQAALAAAGADTAAIRQNVGRAARAVAADPATRQAVREARQSGDTAAARAAIRDAAGANGARARAVGAARAGGAGGRGAANGGLQSLTSFGLKATIAQDAKSLTITRATQLGNFDTKVNLDGSPFTNTVERNGNTITQTSSSVWDGDKLMIKQTIKSEDRTIETITTLWREGDELVVSHVGAAGQTDQQRFVKAP